MSAPRWAGVVLAAALVVSACSRPDAFTVPPPPTTLPPTSTTPPVDYSDDALPRVPGRTTTSTIPVQPGPATLQGVVGGPDGPVPGAAVHIERLVGDAAGVLIVGTGEDGSWAAPGVLGGRYRVRAWRSPDLALTKPEILFLEGSQTRQLRLELGRFAGLHAGAAIAPDPPTVGQPASLVVLVTTRSVDADGVVRATPVVGIRVELFGGGRWQLDSQNVTSTDGAGQARWQLRCRQSGQQPLSVLVGDTDSFPLELPPCSPEPEPEPTSTTSTTRRPTSTTAA